MSQEVSMHVIAHIESDFREKFGIPRQSGLVPELRAKIVFAPEYRNSDALRGLEGFSHIWLIWQFSKAVRRDWSPTVRPPRLGGNTRMGIFATRSPFRPNAIGLSAVRLEDIRQEKENGTVLIVSGADLLDGTPIFDIKPYLPYADAIPDAAGGFAQEPAGAVLTVEMPEALTAAMPEGKRRALIGVLQQDPRPRYQDDPGRVYGLRFGDFEVRFKVAGDKLTVCAVENAREG